MSIKNTIKMDKIKVAIQRLKTGIVDLRVERLSKLSNKTLVRIGAGALGAIIICTAWALTTRVAGSDENLSMLAKEEVASATTTCYAIQINGQKVVTLASQDDAEAVLNGVTDYYKTDGAELISVAYSESVEMVEVQEEDPVLMSVNDAVSMIITGTKEPKTYIVEDGDNLWDISLKCDMSVDELTVANPNADPDALKIGYELNLYDVKPYLHLTLTEQLTATENINYNVTYEETSTLYKGEIKVKEAGIYGQRQVTKEIVKENGTLISNTELSSQIINEPKSQVNLKGTKSVSTLVGTGSFVGPMGYLEVSSPFGSRGGARHNGVDLRNPRGTPIYVVDDGVITFVGYQGTFGNIVKISHGNGIETWYAHCDTMLVSIGDVVKKGEQIATVGNTGRTTGYHLHFEVRKNGVPQNPMNYL